MSPLHSSSLPAAPTGYSRIPLRLEIGYLLIIALLLVVARSLAQDASTGALRGSVADPDNQVIAGATVVVVNSATNRRYSTESNADGNYAVELLPPGDYSARAAAPGMSPQLSPPLRVDVGVATELNFRLSIAGVKENVTVSGAPPMVETQPAAVSTLIEERAISDLPLNGRRFTDLALLAPGVTQDPRGLTSASNGDLAFGGIRGYQSSYLVDGADNNNAFFAQARGRYRAPYQFSNEVVQEFRVSSNSYGAEQGRAGGRRSGQCDHQVRLQPLARYELLFSARQRIQRSTCLYRHQTQRPPAAIRLHLWRSGQTQQTLFLLGIRPAHLSRADAGAFYQRGDGGRPAGWNGSAQRWRL